MILLAENALIAKIPGRFSVYLSKLLCKITDGIEADKGRDFLDRQTGMLQKAGGLHTAFFVYKSNKGHAHVVTELMGKVIRVYGQFLGGVLDGQIAVEIVLDIDDCLMGKTAEVLIGLLLHQTAILLDNIDAEGRHHIRRIQPFDLHADLIG